MGAAFRLIPDHFRVFLCRPKLRWPRPELKRLVGIASKPPCYPSVAVLHINGPFNAHLCETGNHSAAEAVPSRRCHRGTIALRPTDRERLSIACPGHVDTASLTREGTVFSSIGGELVQRHADALRGGRSEGQYRTL